MLAVPTVDQAVSYFNKALTILVDGSPVFKEPIDLCLKSIAISFSSLLGPDFQLAMALMFVCQTLEEWTKLMATNPCLLGPIVCLWSKLS